MGATASGKTAVAEALAQLFDAQLINADAFQVYCGLDIGTAKPDDPQKYRLLDLISPHEDFGVGLWVKLAHTELSSLKAEGRSAIIVGGSGYYVRALTEEFSGLGALPDPTRRQELRSQFESEGLEPLLKLLKESSLAEYETVDRKNPVRVMRALERTELELEPALKIPYARRLKISVEQLPEVLDERILRRTSQMLERGWMEEVNGLLNAGIHLNAPGMRAIGYKEIALCLEGEIPKENLASEIALRTRQYAKRQRTWLRSEPNLVRFSGEDEFDAIQAVSKLVESLA